MDDFRDKCGNVLVGGSTGAAAGGAIGAALGVFFAPITSTIGATIGGGIGCSLTNYQLFLLPSSSLLMKGCSFMPIDIGIVIE